MMFNFRASTFAASLIALGLIAAMAISPQALAAPANGPATAVDWPHFRFDKNHTGNQPHETALSKDSVKFAGPLWVADLPGELVFSSSPAVVKGVVYIGDSDGNLTAWPANGCGAEECAAPLWQSTNLAQIVDSPTVANGVLYIGSQTNFNDASGKLNAFKAKGCGKSVCAPIWQGDAGPTSILESSPTVWNGIVFVGAYGGKLYAFNADGCGQKLCQPIWTGEMGGTESTPLVYNGVVYIGSDDGHLYAFNAAGCGNSSCQPLWTGDTHGPVFDSSPAVSKGVVYIGSNHALSAFDATGCGAATCAAQWQAIDDNNFFGGSPAVANGRVYIGLESGVNVYRAKGCGQKTCRALATLFGSGMQDGIGSSPTVANGVVYAGRNSGEVLAWNADCSGTCSELWKGLTDDPIVNSSPTVVNGTIYIGSSDHGFFGRLYVYGLTN